MVVKQLSEKLPIHKYYKYYKDVLTKREPVRCDACGLDPDTINPDGNKIHQN